MLRSQAAEEYVENFRTPFLIAKDSDGAFRLTLRTTWFNMYNCPTVTAPLQDEILKSAGAARAFATANLGAQAGEFAKQQTTAHRRRAGGLVR